MSFSVDDDETVSLGGKDSTASTGSKSSRESGFSAKRISLTRELQNLRRQMNKRKRCDSDERFAQMETLGRCLEEELVVHVLKHEEQDNRLAKLESFQQQLSLEQKAHSELIDSDTLEIEELAARIDSLGRKCEVRDNELMKLTQRFKETRAECNVKFEDSHTRHAEDRKICQSNNARCTQLEELMQRFETQIAETNAKLSAFESEHALHTPGIEGQDDRIAELESFHKQMAVEQKAQSEQLHSELALNTHEIKELAARIDSLSCKGEVHDRELMDLAQRLKEISAECNVKFEESHTLREEDHKICQNNNERCSQLEKLMHRFETQIAFQKQLGLGQKAQSEQIDSELTLNKSEIKELAARIDALGHKREVRDKEVMELAQRFKEISVECNVEFEDIHKRCAEDRKICHNNNERCSQLEELMQCFKTQIAETHVKISEFESRNALHTRKIEGQDDRITELESQKLLNLEHKAQNEHIESERALRTREQEGLRSQVNVVGYDEKFRNNERRDLTQRFEQTSAELNVKLEKSHTWRAQVFKICQKSNEWRSQLKELTQRLETKIMKHKLKFDQRSELDHTGDAPMNFETFRDELESRLASERKTCQEIIEAGGKSHASGLQDLSAMFSARIEDLTSCLDAGYADCEEKQKEQNQAKISCKTPEPTLAEKISSQKKIIEAESILRHCVQMLLTLRTARAKRPSNA